MKCIGVFLKCTCIHDASSAIRASNDDISPVSDKQGQPLGESKPDTNHEGPAVVELSAVPVASSSKVDGVVSHVDGSQDGALQQGVDGHSRATSIEFSRTGSMVFPRESSMSIMKGLKFSASGSKRWDKKDVTDEAELAQRYSKVEQHVERLRRDRGLDPDMEPRFDPALIARVVLVSRLSDGRTEYLYEVGGRLLGSTRQVAEAFISGVLPSVSRTNSGRSSMRSFSRLQVSSQDLPKSASLPRDDDGRDSAMRRKSRLMEVETNPLLLGDKARTTKKPGEHGVPDRASNLKGPCDVCSMSGNTRVIKKSLHISDSPTRSLVLCLPCLELGYDDLTYVQAAAKRSAYKGYAQDPNVLRSLFLPGSSPNSLSKGVGKSEGATLPQELARELEQIPVDILPASERAMLQQNAAAAVACCVSYRLYLKQRTGPKT